VETTIIERYKERRRPETPKLFWGAYFK
jgi:hypothetical protein